MSRYKSKRRSIAAVVAEAATAAGLVAVAVEVVVAATVVLDQGCSSKKQTAVAAVVA